MKNWIVYSFFMLMHFVVFTQSIETTKSTAIKDNFEFVNIAAYEIHGHKKVNELVEYLQLFTQTNQDEQLKIQISENITQLFVKSPQKITSFHSKKSFKDPRLWLEELQNENIAFRQVKLVSAQLFDTYWFYNYTLHFTMNGKEYQKEMVVQMYLQQTPKKFGSNSKSVWQLAIGSIQMN